MSQSFTGASAYLAINTNAERSLLFLCFWLIASCYLLIASFSYFAPVAIFFTMASTSLRSLSFRFIE
jgi:hypothetical protein